MVKERILGGAPGLYQTFERKGGTALTATHYCSGCGHGVLHKLIGEAMVDLGIQDRTIMISPVGCAVFAYYYLDCGNVQAAHGRATAVGTGIARVVDDAIIISYQGDGDLCAIGLNETLHTANRGERMAVFFVNNATYGMTGGQMAPTTLLGQKTATTPQGRDAADTGYPLHACELINQFTAPVYIERCSVADAPHIRVARRALRKALQIQKEGKGFAFVEFLSPCPTGMHCKPIEAARLVTEQLEKEFPLGCLRDRSDEARPPPRIERHFDGESLARTFEDYGGKSEDPILVPDLPAKRVRIAGFGGQGVMSLGAMLAWSAQTSRRFLTYFPSYGPEQRGGTANCSVVVSGQPVGSPVFLMADVLVALNRPSLEHFGPLVNPTGVIIYDADAGAYTPSTGVRALAVPAKEIALATGATAQAANTVMLGVLARVSGLGLSRESFDRALAETFGHRPTLAAANRKVLDASLVWADQHANTLAGI